jgi:hypothetical protein
MTGHRDHSDLWSYIDGLREDLGRAEERIRELEDRVGGLEKDRPQAQQLQLEADLAAADLAESGYGREHHGRDCQCPFCYYDPEEDDDTYACSMCGALIGMFIGRSGWHHYRGDGTAASPVEIYDAGHEATFAAGDGPEDGRL